ncbi:hypothetical protein [Acetivibrio clariflavus]|uniref:Uncharacterized protein n=1 Tax=Acetivibrio clariflavus (strain DSM 19732 / NBRC 101661 / EBR45) TaxID=720554 RepID=G8LSV5_ACECE|nr:hypothetical protein [Acetivibrio clariflavus]AEV70468.1 hypothetical protein Clocl_4032 [Acetivibrio clariflavus DSM 19732]HOQ02131.1 hypothetical protein [Acetivibrio clariflavus]HPU42376.1 hypothetical protein [Acetivibrio clariflavus]
MQGKVKKKVYRVWHTEKKNCSKFDTKEIEEVCASNIKEARQIVKEMYPSHRVTSVWLIEK